MNSIVDLLDLLPPGAALHERLNETDENIQLWRRAGAVPPEKVGAIVDWAILEGHSREVIELAAKVAPAYAGVAAILHELGKRHDAVQQTLIGIESVRGADESEATEIGPIARILEDMHNHRLFEGDPVTRVRALRDEWTSHDGQHDRIRSGDLG